MNTSAELATDYADTMVESIAEIMGRYDGTGHYDDGEHACQHCARVITLDSEGRWIDPEGTGDDSVWRETCDAHDTFVAEHEPEECGCQDRAREELDESYALELVAERGEPYSVLLTYGGPNAWVEWTARTGTSNAALHVYWGGGEAVRRSAAIRSLADYYAEIMEAD